MNHALARIERQAERSAYRAQVEIRAMAVRARRSLGQKIRWAKWKQN